MIELSPQLIAIIMFGCLLVGVLVGIPIAIVIGFIALVVGYMTWGDKVGILLYSRVFSVFQSYVLLAAPLFIFMGMILARSGITDKLFTALHLWLGGFRGGLAIATVLIGTILAACTGIVSASVSMLSIVAIPAMVERGYNKSFASGAVCAGGTLGILIPPSIMLVVYGPMANLSVGKLFMAAFLPGLVLSGLYCTYISILSWLRPEVAPGVPSVERAIPLSKKVTLLLSSLVPPSLLILAVLGSIFFGVAAPTEAAGVGAFVATLLTAAYGKLNWQVLRETGLATVKLVGMVFLVVIAAFAFVGVFIGSGAGEVVENVITGAPFGKWGALATILLVVFILGFFLDWIGIVLLIVPIITPIGYTLGFDPIWLAMLVCVDLQTSYMTPPLAYSIFIVQNSAPPQLGITARDVMRGVIPFVISIVVGLGLCIMFPQIILWLPGLMIK